MQSPSETAASRLSNTTVRPDSPTGGALLVAPPDPHRSAFLEVSAQPLSCRALVVGSADDPYRGAAGPGRWRS
ncbi:alpha/beta hydrolase [Streptomyces sp. NBS 14/10]|nr:alpha/beta hydrolase [Streptomyces sp. NBS 14/10]KAK1183901.1 alpha/beta hydrolase [Streptomyces sp. NBS 14/10]